MMDFISVPLIVGIIFLGTYKLFELFVCKSERLKIIEKISDRLDSVDITGKLSLPSYRQSQFSFGTLKGGCLMVGIGVGLLIGFFINIIFLSGHLTNNTWGYSESADIVYGSCVLLFGGLGLLIAFLVEVNIEKKKKKEKSN